MPVLALGGLRRTLRQTRPWRVTDAATGAIDAATEGDRHGHGSDRRGLGGDKRGHGGDRRVCRTFLASACSGGGDRRGGAEHQTRLLIDFVKWSLLECVLQRDGR
jgi:hypothetical protein